MPECNRPLPDIGSGVAIAPTRRGPTACRRAALSAAPRPIGRLHPVAAGIRRCLGASLLAAALLPGLTPALGAVTHGPIAAHRVAAQAAPTIALHYGHRPPLHLLRAFDIVVVEPAHGLDPSAYRQQNNGQSELFAYLSVGEVGRERKLPVPMPDDMLLGTNAHWQSRYVEPSHPDWPRYFVDRLVAPLWAQGYRGFFLDTLDAYQALPGDAAKRAAREAALVSALQALKSRFPEARLIANRGFELLPQIHPLLMAVAAESLYGRWDVASKAYAAVPPADREWLLGQFRQARDMGLQTLAIDYADPTRRDEQAAVAAKILRDGVTPYVTDGDLVTVGTGQIKVRPRTLLVVHNGTQKGDEQFSTAQEVVVMPLHYLGYRVELLDVNRHDLPTGPVGDRFAGIVGVFETDITNQGRQWVDLLGRAVRERVPVVLLNSFGAPIANLPSALGLGEPEKPPLGPLTLAEERRPLTSFETPAMPDLRSVFVTAPAGADRLVRVRDRRGQVTDGVALTDWGGYALQPFTYNIHAEGMNWIIDPIEFFRRALARPDMPPVADVSTETGRRMLMVHIDGDGFASRAEIPGAPFAAEVMQKDFIARYKVPHTVSVIEGETGPEGLYPALSPTLERIARNIFKLDHVEIATHSYSHPFFWNKLVAEAASGTLELFPDKPVSLPIPNYRFSLEREVAGSASYIDERLAPPGKRTSVFLWTGDCVPPSAAIEATTRAGLLNMNGGDTTITRQYPTLTRVAPMSLRKDGQLQVYAPNQNENVYTNNWTGPFYGFERVIETFEMTEAPLRLKPINIYYHTYAASKTSSIKALHAVYRYALSQAVNPVYGSDYIRKVHDYESITFSQDIPATDAPGEQPAWRIRSGQDLRTVRVPDAAVPRIDWHASEGIAGFAQGRDGSYVHLSAADARLVYVREPGDLPPIVESGNGRLSALRRDGHDLSFRFSSYVPPEFRLVHASQCRVTVDGRPLKARTNVAFTSPAARSGQRLFRYSPKLKDARSGILVSVDC